MKSDAIKKVFKKLKKKNIKFYNWTALEFFARDGSWQTIDYSGLVKFIIGWEIDQKYKKDFIKNIKNSSFYIGDSFNLLKKRIFFNKFDMILLDNPQNTFGKNNQYCEHFEVLPKIKKLFKNDNFLLIFNINKNPFDLNKFPEWKLRRDSYYNFDSKKISSHKILNFYKKILRKYGYRIIFSFEQKRNLEYLSYLVFYLKKIS